jgi:hypothetical protein
MNRGFSLVEVVLALLLLQVGLLATVGMVFLSQENFRRAELTTRGVLEAAWTADSLAWAGGGGAGAVLRPWGEVSWVEMATPVAGSRVSAFSILEADTLVTVMALPPLRGSLMLWPDSVPMEERW